jgi:hypothetical protein
MIQGERLKAVVIEDPGITAEWLSREATRGYPSVVTLVEEWNGSLTGAKTRKDDRGTKLIQRDVIFLKMLDHPLIVNFC